MSYDVRVPNHCWDWGADNNTPSITWEVEQWLAAHGIPFTLHDVVAEGGEGPFDPVVMDLQFTCVGDALLFKLTWCGQ